MRLQFLFLQLSGRAQILHARAFNRAIEFERGLIVVLKPDWRAEVDAEVEAIVGRKDQRRTHWYHARRDVLAVDFQDHLERAGRPALHVGRLDFDLRLAGGQFVFGLDMGPHDLEQIVFVRQHAVFDVQGEATGKPAQCVEHAVGIGRHVGVNANKVFFVAERGRGDFRHPRDGAREGPRCVWRYQTQFRMEDGNP